MKLRRAFGPFRAAASAIAGDKARLLKVLAVAAKKAHRDPSVLKEIWADLQTLLQMLKAWAVGEYREIPARSLGLAIAAVLYFVSPIDAILDFLPGGFVDDIAILAAVLASLRADVTAFRAWREAREPRPHQERRG